MARGNGPCRCRSAKRWRPIRPCGPTCRTLLTVCSTSVRCRTSGSPVSLWRGGLRVLKYSYRPDGQGAAVLAAIDDLLGSGILVSAFIYINWAYDAVDRRAIEGALARAPDEQREAVISVMAQEREQGRIEGEALGKARGKAETLLRLLERRFHGVPKPYHAQVLAADVVQLDTWIDAVLEAESIDAVFGGPTAH